MNPFLKRIAKRTGDTDVLSWLLVIMVDLELTEDGVQLSAGVHRLVEGRPKPFGPDVPELCGLEYRRLLNTNELYWQRQFIFDGYLQYHGLKEEKDGAEDCRKDIRRLLERRYKNYMRQHGKPTYLGWSLVTMANVFGAHNIHFHAEGRGWIVCHSLFTASCQVEEAVYILQRQYQRSTGRPG
ncbi:MAG: hypothetical protein RJA22_2661 [Verrucomicrobiota bacterium]